MKQKFLVTGMTCAACSSRVEKVTKAVEGVIDAQVNLMGGTMVVESANDVKDAAYGLPVRKRLKRKIPKVN